MTPHPHLPDVVRWGLHTLVVRHEEALGCFATRPCISSARRAPARPRKEQGDVDSPVTTRSSFVLPQSSPLYLGQQKKTLHPALRSVFPQHLCFMTPFLKRPGGLCYDAGLGFEWCFPSLRLGCTCGRRTSEGRVPSVRPLGPLPRQVTVSASLVGVLWRDALRTVTCPVSRDAPLPSSSRPQVISARVSCRSGGRRILSLLFRGCLFLSGGTFPVKVIFTYLCF